MVLINFHNVSIWGATLVQWLARQVVLAWNCLVYFLIDRVFSDFRIHFIWTHITLYVDWIHNAFTLVSYWDFEFDVNLLWDNIFLIE